MPIPTPSNDENHEEFMDRCMSEETMNHEYPDGKQRYAVCQFSWNKKEEGEGRDMEELRKVISYQAAHGNIGYSEDAWDGPGMEAKLKNDGDAAYYKKAFAYVDPEANPDTKTAYKFIHHMVDADGSIGAANLRACSASIAILNGGRGGTNIPKDEYQGVYNHVAQHLKDAEREVPELKRSKDKYEIRTLTLRAEDIKADEKIHAKIASFNSLSENLGGYYEKIAPGAFKKTIQESDIRALLNHDPNYVLGRVKSGTIKLCEDETGLMMECTPPDTQWARDLMTSVKRGDIDQCSFGFRIVKDSYDYDSGMDHVVRTLNEVELFDVSIVTYPAYLNTSAFIRSLNKSEIMRELVNLADKGKIDCKTLEDHLKLLVEPDANHSNDKDNNSGKPSFNETLAEQRKREVQIKTMIERS